jgi:hypothetical protein
MITWQRLIYYLGLAVVEATPAALLVTLAGGDAWAPLIGVALAGALADWVFLRRLRPAHQGPALAIAALLAGVWVVRGQVAPGAGLLSGWGTAVGTIFSLGGARAGGAYLSLLTALYCFWRGTRMTLHDSITLHRLFRLSTVGLIMIIGFGFFGRRASGDLATLVSTEMLIFFAAGLMTIALASASEERETELRRLGWRGMLTLLASVATVLVVGLLLGSLFGREAAQIVRLLWLALVLILLLIVAPIIYLMSLLLEPLLRLINMDQILGNLVRQIPQPFQNQSQSDSQLLGGLPPWLQVALRTFISLLPILLLVALFLLSRRRARRSRGADEERESLWSWSGLAADLRGLLTRRAPQRVEGLREALARLRGGDPASRIRRSYIRLLLLGEAREQPRAGPQTPREYTGTAGALLPAATQSIETLTDAYERARYHPAAATAADADAAEKAWGAIDQAGRTRS